MFSISGPFLPLDTEIIDNSKVKVASSISGKNFLIFSDLFGEISVSSLDSPRHFHAIN